MYVNGVSVAPIQDRQAFEDNYLRIFYGTPQFSDPELKMLKDWAKNNQLGEVMIYLTDEKFRGMNADIAEFCMRELLRGNL